MRLSLIGDKLYLLKTLRIDVYLFLFMLGYYIGQVPTTQLIEDKICINELSLGTDVCQNFATTSNVTETERLIVLGRMTTIKSWQTILSTLPGVLISLFTGFWIDSYPAHIRYLLMIPCIATALQSLTLLVQCLHFNLDLFFTYWSFLFMGIGGSLPLVLTCSFTYVTRKTERNHRSIRFAFVELFLLLAQTVATALGAQILSMDSWLISGQRNYCGVYLVNTIIMIMATVWVLTLLTDCSEDDVNEDNETIHVCLSIEQIEENSRELVDHSKNGSFYRSTDDCKEQISKPKSPPLAIIQDTKKLDLSQQSPQTDGKLKISKLPLNSSPTRTNHWSAIRSIINLGNITTTFETCFRKRENNDRTKVINLFFSIFILFISLLSESNFGFQFTEKVFHWDYRYYSNINAGLSLIQAFGALIGVVLFKCLLNCQDSSIAAIATLSHLWSNIFKGIGYQETYIVGYIVYGISGMSIPSARSTLTQLIQFHEIAQIFTILSCIQATSPMVSSIFCSKVFQLTMVTLPGVTYHAVAMMLFYPLTVFLWINLSQRKLRHPQNRCELNLNRDQSKGLENVTLAVALDDKDNNKAFDNHTFSSKF